jgi:negative regulator of flagellin synthesis FlgM
MVDPFQIQRVSGTTPASRVEQRREAATAAGGNAPAPAPSRPTIPRLVSLAGELVRQGPPYDYAKIAQIKAAIALGSYEVDVDRIAASILGPAPQDAG